jgi:hypothetical protein
MSSIKPKLEAKDIRPSLTCETSYASIEARYQEQLKIEKVNFLIYGRTGTGKSHLLSTAPKPVLIHSFDPGGTKPLLRFKNKEKIQDGFRYVEYLIDTRFEIEDANSPTAYKLWESDVNALQEKGMFKNIGTYVIDSGTNWLQAQMNEILAQKKRGGEAPELQDWNNQQLFACQALNILCNLPCNFILIGHIDTFKDEVDGRVHTSLFAAGKNKVKIPLGFDEVYVLNAKETPTGIQRELIARVSSKHDARTRIGEENPSLPPDIRQILRNAGYPWQDKPLPKVKAEEKK